MRELLLEIWTSVRRNKLRTFLTGFSVAWGIFMLVILLGSGNGLKNGVTSNFGNYATNSIDLYGGRTSKPYMGYQKGRRIRLWNSDLEILAREFPEVDEVAANSWFDNHTATYGNEYTKVWLRGSLPKIEQIEGVEIVKGRFVNDADIREYRKSLVIDQAMQSLLFKGADPLGARIKLDSTVFTVVGVYKGDAQRSSSSCYIPLTTGQLLYNANSPEVNNAIITIKGVHTTEAMKEFEKRVIRRLSAEHHFAPDDESAIWLDNTMETYKNFMMVFAGINVFVWIIGLGDAAGRHRRCEQHHARDGHGAHLRIRHTQGAGRQTRVDHQADPHRVGDDNRRIRLPGYGIRRGDDGRGQLHAQPDAADGRRPCAVDLPQPDARPGRCGQRDGRAGHRRPDRRLRPRLPGRTTQDNRRPAL